MRLRSSLALAALAVSLAAGTARAQASAWSDWDAFYRDFTSWRLDSTHVARVASLLIERDACTIALEDGRIALSTPLAGHVRAAVFVGRGTLLFTPRTEIERQQLRRFYDVPTLRRPFARLTLVFADTTLAELQATLSFHADSLGALRRAWAATFPYLTVRRQHAVRPDALAQTLLDGEDNGYFWALASDVKSEEPLFFSLDPTQAERVELSRRPEGDRAGLVRFYRSETVCRFFAAGDADTLRHDLLPPVAAVHYGIHAALDADLDLHGAADLALVANGRPRAWLGLELPDDYKVAEVSGAARTFRWHQEKENDRVWVHCEPPLAPGETTTVRIRYDGRCFDREDDAIFHRHDVAWYPRPWAGADATWDLTFEHPRNMQLVAAGELLARTESARVARSTWRVSRPVPWASFDMEFLRGVEVSGDSVPPVTVWRRHVDGAGRVNSATFASLSSAKDEDARVARDVARCLGFFRRSLGEPLATRFNAVETPLLRYTSFPGLIHMMPESDHLVPGAEWTPDAVRAHEIAHQWFGMGVAPATYHDMWLAEGFANFCAIWYLQAERKDSRSYLNMLSSWRSDLLENRHFLLGEAQQAGPVWLGPRTRSSRTPSDYHLVVYTKGAWVLHMLRNVLLSNDDPEETRFRGLMRDFYAKFAGRSAFTEDFRAAVERAAGEDMGWFFDQWVYGTDVPTYRFTWKTEAAKDGMWRVHGHVEQSNVPEKFRMPVLVRVNFDGNRYSRTSVWVSGRVTDFDLPLAPGRPESVVFNDLESVLCEVVK
jgi:hypothetical protein